MKERLPIDQIQEAWQLATKMHHGQKYGGPDDGEHVEYMNHIGSVAFEVLAATMIESDLDRNLAIHCAILHDIVEDSDLSPEELVTRFGKSIADGVLALTKSKKIEGKQEKMLDSLQRIKQQPREVWAVKMADRICNLYAPPFYWDNAKKLTYLEEARLIHRELQEGSKYLADRLASKIAAYQRFIA